jgi:hypothetical protein
MPAKDPLPAPSAQPRVATAPDTAVSTSGPALTVARAPDSPAAPRKAQASPVARTRDAARSPEPHAVTAARTPAPAVPAPKPVDTSAPPQHARVPAPASPHVATPEDETTSFKASMILDYMPEVMLYRVLAPKVRELMSKSKPKAEPNLDGVVTRSPATHAGRGDTR